MNFGLLEIDDEVQAFWDDVRAFLDVHLTDEVYEEEWRTGAGHNVAFHRALGERRWVIPRWPADDGGAGLTARQDAILQRELGARHAPLITRGTTAGVFPAVVAWAGEELKAEVVRGVLGGEICFCLGYTEPDSGSDIAAAKTRAVRDGDEWVINGQKMFTTGAHNCQYAFLITRTNPEAPKHKGLTMFLCPLDEVEIQAVHTLGGERTNMVFFDDIHVPDRYRLGDVDAGWTVLMGPLNAEHGMGQHPFTLENRGGMYGSVAAVAHDVALDWAREPGPGGRRPIDDRVTRRRLARVALDVECTTASPGPMGRVLSSELFIRDAAELIRMVGARGLLPHGEEGAIGDGWLEYAHRFAQGTATYGGTTDIHRNIIAERILGLPRSAPSGSK
jgi:alkylation response protein AidB-like acyl-CoA dehydrogenase